MEGRQVQVKNRGAAPIQITAEHLLREAKERGLESGGKAPKILIADKEELQQYQHTKRKDFEEQIRRQRLHLGIWSRYALWEASMKEYDRARSVFERALDVDYKNPMIWIKYGEMEMKSKFINHARNIWDRAVSLLPRVDVFWYKYTYMEELIGAVDSARAVFERWMKWEPDDNAWNSYIKFELRQEQPDKCRALYERYIQVNPTARAFLKYAKFEEKQYQRKAARRIYERSIEELHPEEKTDKFLLQYARFLDRCKEVEPAREVFNMALDYCKTHNIESEELKAELLAFERRQGTKDEIEDSILNNRRLQYENALKSDKYSYDTWFDYIHLEEAEGNFAKIRAVYDRAVECVPPVLEKRYWKRYIYLWINYFMFEELQAQDISKARELFKKCLFEVIPNRNFTFGKIWIYAALFEVRQKNLVGARKIFDQGIGICEGKENIMKSYIDLELQLGEIDRCRALYAKYLECMPYNCSAWKAFANMEHNVGEVARTRAIYELAVTQPELDMPEILWRSFIDFEIAENEVENVRILYERLLERTSHVKVWISFGQFECSHLESIDSPEINEIEVMRSVFKKGYDTLKRQELKEERVLLLEAWRACEEKLVHCGGSTVKVDAMMPRKVKMTRAVEDIEDGGSEEYYDYRFPDDEKSTAGLKILEKAMMWKQQMGQSVSISDDSSSSRKRQLEEL